MNTFFLSINLSATFVSATPTLEILLDGQVVSASQITEKTGNGTMTLGFTLSSTSADISSLSFRFASGGSEQGRSITIESVSINNYELATSVYIPGEGPAVITQGETLDINVNAIDYVFGQADAELADLGTVTLQGKNSSEKLVGGKQAAVIDGKKGHDEIRAGQEADSVYGGEGNDRIYGNDGDDFLIGAEGNDVIYGRGDNDLVYGGEGDDRLNGGDGNDVLSGGVGQDKLYGESGNDILDGGADNDLIYGQEGDDNIDGGDGNDRIFTGVGTDIASGGAGDDDIFAEGGSNTLNGGLGNDTLKADADAQVDTLNGGEGDDDLIGNVGNDIINGDEGDDRIEGRAGNDEIDGGDGDDLIYGQEGHDTIYGGDGARDDIYGGDGNDTIYGEEGFDKLFGEDGHDTIYGGDDIDVIRGGTGHDVLHGDAGDDRLFGDDGDDTLNGGEGNDWLRGLAGADIINGGAGDDTIIHDDNVDTIDGGAGYDILHLAGTNLNDINVANGELNAVNIEQISLDNYNGVAVANTLTISIADISSISSAGTLYITGDAGVDTITVSNLDEVGDFVNTVNIGGIDYDYYQQGSYSLYVQNTVTLSTSTAPLAIDDSFAGTEGSNVAGNVLVDNGAGVDADPAGGVLSVVADVITTAGGGIVTLLSTGDFIYVPQGDFYGVDTFNYVVQNGLTETDTGLVTLNVAGVNDGPVAQDDSFTATKNIDLSGDFLADNGNGEDTDLETLVLSAQAETITTGNGATVVINADGTFTYTPPTGFIGPDSFNYTLTDDDGGTDVGSVSIVVQDANALPAGDISLNYDGGASTSVSNSSNINTGGPYDAKTTIVQFTTDADVTTRQVLYEQGGGTRGINIYIEGGQIHMATWNFAEENWGYKEVTTSIGGNETHTAALVFDGELPASGTITGFLDGTNVGTDTGVGLLYGHSGEIGVGQADGSTVYNGSNSTASNVFLGEIGNVVQYNEVLSEADIAAVEANLGTPQAVFVIEDVQQETVPNDPAINDGGPYAEKTMSVAFTAGADVTARQVVYEQGGTVRGMSIFIEGGQLHVAAWNFAEEDWGYKEVTTAINADEFYTATLLLDGVQNETGTLTGFINGIEFGEVGGVGLLYNHPGAIGVGEQVSGAYYSDGSDSGNNVYVFGGTIERLAQYNDALEGSYLLELHSTMASENPNVTGNTFIGDANDNAIGGGNGDDNIQGRDGDDSISGNGGNDTIRGENDNDVLYGNSGDDFLYGGNGDDVLVGGSGVDVMYGDAGFDTFGFVQMDGNIDQIRDFTLTGGSSDVLNLTDILEGFDLGVDDITDFVIVNVVNSARTDIRIDANGDGSGSEVIAIVRGSDFTGNDAQDLLNSGSLIVDQSIL